MKCINCEHLRVLDRDTWCECFHHWKNGDIRTFTLPFQTNGKKKGGWGTIIHWAKTIKALNPNRCPDFIDMGQMRCRKTLKRKYYD